MPKPTHCAVEQGGAVREDTGGDSGLNDCTRPGWRGEARAEGASRCDRYRAVARKLALRRELAWFFFTPPSHMGNTCLGSLAKGFLSLGGAGAMRQWKEVPVCGSGSASLQRRWASRYRAWQTTLLQGGGGRRVLVISLLLTCACEWGPNGVRGHAISTLVCRHALVHACPCGCAVGGSTYRTMAGSERRAKPILDVARFAMAVHGDFATTAASDGAASQGLVPLKRPILHYLMNA